MIIRCCEVSDIAARPPHAVQLAKEDVSHSAFGIIRTAVKMRVDRGIRFLGREEIEHLDFPSWISSRVQRKLGICSRQAGRRKSGRRGRSGPDPHAITRGERPQGGGPGSRGLARTQPTSPASLNFDGLYRKITLCYLCYYRGYLISAPRAIERVVGLTGGAGKSNGPRNTPPG